MLTDQRCVAASSSLRSGLSKTAVASSTQPWSSQGSTSCRLTQVTENVGSPPSVFSTAMKKGSAAEKPKW